MAHGLLQCLPTRVRVEPLDITKDGASPVWAPSEQVLGVARRCLPGSAPPVWALTVYMMPSAPPVWVARPRDLAVERVRVAPHAVDSCRAPC